MLCYLRTGKKMKKEIERLEGKMKQYIGKDACYGVWKCMSVSSRIWRVMRDWREGQEMREMDGEILEAKVEETRVHALKHETLTLVSVHSVHLWQWQKYHFRSSQKYHKRQSDIRSPDKAGIKLLEKNRKLSSASVCEPTHLRWGHTYKDSQRERETSCLDVVMKHQMSLRERLSGR